jgi:hypothetical protein
MPLITDYFHPAELTELSRAIQADLERPEHTDYWLQRDALASDYQNDIEYRVKAGESGVPRQASFRAWDTQNEVGSIPGFTESIGQLLPLGQKYVMTELDRLAARRAEVDEYRAALAKFVEHGTLGTLARMDKAVADTLLTGLTTLTNERGVTQEADWGRNANRSYNGAFTWDDPATSKPLVDLTGAMELVDRQGVFIMNRPTALMIARSESVRALAGVSSVGTPDVVSPAFVSQVFGAYDITMRQYNAKYKDAAGAEQYILPTGKVLFVGGSAGRTVWGVTREAMSPSYGIDKQVRAGLVAAHTQSDDPIQDIINVSAIGFPVLANPDATAALTVVF